MESEEMWKITYQHEITQARSAREAGNEGMARVCARRAAGVIIGEYLTRQGITNLSYSTVDQISIFITIPGLNNDLKDNASHFLTKVNPDHTLPGNIDLISDAQWLYENLLLETKE